MTLLFPPRGKEESNLVCTSSQLDEILIRVAKPGRYVGGEFNSVHKDAASVAIRAALAFPDVYEVGMSSLGFQVLYDRMNRRADTFCERVFAPWPDMEAELRKAGLLLYTLETCTSLRDLDLLGFSLGSETTYTNVLTCLDLGGIPLRSADREESHPIVIAGGHCAFSPEPMAEFMDAFVIGEGEEVIDEVLDSLLESQGRAREERLLALAGIEGVYVPRFLEWSYAPSGELDGYRTLLGAPERVTKRVVREFETLEPARRPVVPNVEAIHDRVTVEVMRGCTQGCRFCQAGMIMRPVRERSAATVCDIAGDLLPATGYDDVSLVSLSTADYSGVECTVRRLTEELGPQGVSVSLPSLRVDAFSVELAAQIQKVRKTGLTFAPEAGTERLRRAINKNITDADIFGAAEAAWRQGWKRIKLYFMIGLPTETDDDIRGIGRLVHELRRRARQDAGVRLEVSVAVSSFVPKAHTPFQWRGQATPEALRYKIGILRDCTRAAGVKLSWNEPEESRLEAVLARGDRRVGQAILKAWEHGARFDSWQECHKREAWRRAFEQTGIRPEWYANRERPYSEVLPWDHIDAGVSRKYLKLEDQRSVIETRTGDCRSERCHGCGVFRILPEHASFGTCYHD